jgi:hypothetical protein
MIYVLYVYMFYVLMFDEFRLMCSALMVWWFVAA